MQAISIAFHRKIIVHIGGGCDLCHMPLFFLRECRKWEIVKKKPPAVSQREKVRI